MAILSSYSWPPRCWANLLPLSAPDGNSTHKPQQDANPWPQVADKCKATTFIIIILLTEENK